MTPSRLVAYAAVWCFTMVVAVIAYGFLHASYGMLVESRCAGRGYPGFKVTWDFEAYCIKRVDQTDVMKRLGGL